MTEQIIYTELEAIALRWPQGKTEPLDTKITDNTAKQFNISTALSDLTAVGSSNNYWILDSGKRLAQSLTFGGDINYLTEIQVYAEKIGSPGDLVIELYKTQTASESATTFVETLLSTSYAVSIYGCNWAAERFSLSEGKLRDWWFYIVRVGAPPDLVLEIREDDGTGNAPGSTIVDSKTIPASEISTTRGWHHLLDYDPPLQLSPNTYYWAVAHTLNNGGDSNNYYAIYGRGGKGVKSTDCGSTWGSLGSGFYGLANAYSEIVADASAIAPDEATLITSATIPAGNITTPAFYTAQLPEPLILKNGERIFAVLRTTGDQNNHYRVYHSFNDAASGDYAARYGAAWTAYKSNIYLKARGYSYATLYSGVYDYPKAPGSATGYAEVSAYANTGSINVVLIIDGKPSAVASTSSTTPTVLTITDDPTVDNYGSLEWVIAANGDGQADYGKFQPKIKYDKNPVYPRDFGFSELYLLQVKAEAANTLVRLNDKTSIFLANAGDLYQVSEAFRTPVRKLQVLDGQATCDLLGVE